MNRHENIHIIFSLSLFLLFVIGSFFIITYEIRGYQMISQVCESEDMLTTPLAYLNNRLKSEDNVIVDSKDCLRLVNDRTTTYIYYSDGYLKELYVTNEYQVDFSKGDKLFALDYFAVEQNDRLLKFTVGKDNQEKDLNIYLHG